LSVNVTNIYSIGTKLEEIKYKFTISKKKRKFYQKKDTDRKINIK